MHHCEVCFVLFVLQVRVIRRDLVWSKHAFIDNDFGRQATDIKHVSLLQVGSTAQIAGNGDCAIQFTLPDVAAAQRIVTLVATLLPAMIGLCVAWLAAGRRRTRS